MKLYDTPVEVVDSTAVVIVTGPVVVATEVAG